MNNIDGESLGHASDHSRDVLSTVSPKAGSKLAEFRDKHAKCIEVLRKAGKNPKQTTAVLSAAEAAATVAATAERPEPKEPKKDDAEMILAHVNELWQDTNDNFVKLREGLHAQRGDLENLTSQANQVGLRTVKERMETLDKMNVERAQDLQVSMDKLREALQAQNRSFEEGLGSVKGDMKKQYDQLVKLMDANASAMTKQQQEHTAELKRLRQELALQAQCDKLRGELETQRLKQVETASTWKEEKGKLQAEIDRSRAIAEEHQRQLADPTSPRDAKPALDSGLHTVSRRFHMASQRLGFRSSPLAAIAGVLIGAVLLVSACRAVVRHRGKAAARGSKAHGRWVGAGAFLRPLAFLQVPCPTESARGCSAAAVRPHAGSRRLRRPRRQERDKQHMGSMREQL